MTLPDCAHCSAANTLEVDWAERGVQFCHCSCCGKYTNVVDGLAYKSGTPRRRTPDVRDVNGRVMTDP